ncbi:MAG: SulP family inorganic anion transporter [Anaerolineales bacterium]
MSLSSLKWSRKTLGPDLMSGLTVALVSIPEGMAYAMVAGVNPVYGLYTGMVTTIVASLTGSTSLLVVTLTNALALVTADAIAGLEGPVDITTVFALTFLVGLIMFLLGALKLGSVIRFVSKEVMAGFVFATALLIVLGQYGDLVGYESTLEGANKLFKAVDITLNISNWDIYTAIVGFSSIVLLFGMKRIRAIEKWADILLIVLSSLFVAIVGWATVELVGDIADVPQGLSALPKPTLPDFSMLPVLIAPAIAAAVVGLAESSGVGSAYSNPDGTKSNMSRDFTSQGLGNLVGSFFQALPAGGSLSRTGVNAGGGAMSRWSGVYAGLMLAVVIVVAGGATEYIPMSGLAALLIVIGIEAMEKEGRVLGRARRLSMANSGVALIVIIIAVFEDLTVAIFAGVILSLLAYTFRAAGAARVVQLVQSEDDKIEERPAATELEPNKPVVFELIGEVYFASVYSFDEMAPPPDSGGNTVVIMRLRGRHFYSLTWIEWFEDYNKKLEAHGNKLMLEGVDEELMSVLKASGLLEEIGEEYVFEDHPKRGEALDAAREKAWEWIRSTKPARTEE